MDPNDNCLRAEFFGGLERAARLSRRRRIRRQMEKTEEGNLTKLDLENKENRIYDEGPYSREFLRTSTTISLLPIKVGSLPDATDVISDVISDVSMYQQTSSKDVTKDDVPEVVSTSPLDARRSMFSKHTSSTKSSRKRTITEGGIKGCAAKRKMRRSQAQLNLQNCDRRSAVVQAKFRHSVDSYIQVSLIPDAACAVPVQTETVQNADQPKFNKKFSFELSPDDTSRRLIVVARQRSTDNQALDPIIGSTSLQVSSILRNRSVLNGWYYLHPESTSEPNNGGVQSAVSLNCSAVVSIVKSKSGYGFAVVGERPVTVSRVHCRGPADHAGLQEGDIIWRINRQNVWNFTADSIARIIRLSFDGRVVLEVLRPKQMSRDGMLGRLHYTGNQYNWDESSFDSDSTIDGTLNQIP